MELLGRYDLPHLAPFAAAPEQSWPLNRFDTLLVAQTYAGRPMTTHHTLEIDRALNIDAWAHALARLIREFPELGSRVVPGSRARRVASTPPRAALRERLILDRDSSHCAMERWMSEPIDPSVELPIRVRISPGEVAEQAVTFSLHHSLCDGVGALALFDRFTALAAGCELEPRRSKPFARYREPPRPKLRELVGKLRQLRRPAAQLLDRPERWAGGQLLAHRVIGPSIWGPLRRLTRAAGVSRTSALWHAVATVAARQRLDDATRPLRIVAGVDLRRYLGVPNDALGNWLGTLEHESPPAIGEPASLVELHAALRLARRPETALLTPGLAAGLAHRLPTPLARALFRRVDSDLWPSPFSLMLAPIRIPARHCWPVVLQPRRLWCASTLPRRPGLGLTFTNVGDRVYVAATCQASVLRRVTLERFLDELLDVLVARIAAANWGAARST